MAEEPASPSLSSQPQPPPSSAPPLGSSVIPIVNKLQDIFAQLGSQSTIELPQVAVVGSQSSGKSSVLEALVGRDFLPRGNEICTRRPLVLQLLQTKRKGDGSGEDEWGEFLHLPGKRFYDFSEIRSEIQAETAKEAGGNKGVSDKQIRLKIFSPNVLDITLVDLPGITKVPVGDQPSDIEARIRTMIMSYIKKPSCLILAVTAANSDLANSDALQIAGNADPDGYRTIGIITKLDIMDRGTDARNLLLGKVIPLRLGYVGVVNRSQEDIITNRSIKDALAAEEKFFRSRPVYNGVADRCGVPQLAKKLNQILVQHIKSILPGLKSRISSALVSVAKEHASYGEITESKACIAGQGTLILNILSKYSEAFSSMVEGRNEEMSTSELAGGARIHYIFQSIFVKSLEEVDPCEDLTDGDIQTIIQNATGPRTPLFVPEVPFEVLIRKQIARLLDPSLQCARFIYNELIKISHHCLVNELQRFPVLRKRRDEVIGNFLRDGLEPSETMIGHIIEMEMDYINTSHPNFIGGSKAVEIAQQQIKSSKVSFAMPRQKDGIEPEKAPASERSMKTRGFLARQVNGIVPDQAWHFLSSSLFLNLQFYCSAYCYGACLIRQSGLCMTYREHIRWQKVNRSHLLKLKTVLSGNKNVSSWGISSIFGGGDHSRMSAKENSLSKSYNEPGQSIEPLEQSSSLIHLREPPTVLRPSEIHSEHESIEIVVTKLLLRSYYDIVRKNIEDSIPKAIMHFLVNHTKRELHNVFIRKLYRENLFEEMLQEPDEIAMKRKQTREQLRVLQQAFRTLDELPLEAETVERGYSLSSDSTGLPKIHGLPTSTMYSSGSSDSYSASPKNPKSRKSSHSGELQPHLYADSNGSGRASMPGLYPTVDF
ncbi:hypothetical protein SADUNF_Sadunf07G0101100 [Salix dunnii]|uniref:Dynamin-related protein 3A n=1 Tax=Salix dunnii TaxID=1413687 RepID=A0A835K0R5_9ROSI|nr:hypothetical protein SADUNF_Sadunf07G0101100 [Salix dunnii]